MLYPVCPTGNIFKTKVHVTARMLTLMQTQETQVQLLCSEDPLEKAMATRSSIPAWEIPWTEEPGGLQYMGSQESGTTEWLRQ